MIGSPEQQHSEQKRPPRWPTPIPSGLPEQMGLAEAARVFKLDGKKITSQKLLSWVTRYQIVTPERTGTFRGKPAFIFGIREMYQIAKIVELLEKGYRFQDMVEIVQMIDWDQVVATHQKPLE